MTSGEIVAGAARFRDWLESEGVRTDGSRLGTIISTTSDLMAASTPEEFIRELTEAQKDLVVECFFDAFSFAMVYRTLRRLPSNLLPRSTLKRAIQGPVDPDDENPGDDSVNARSHMFELELACRYMDAGLSVVAFDDILIDLQGTRVNIQCKRIHRIANLESSFFNALAQVQARIPAKASHGAVCISLDRVVGATTRAFVVDPPDSLVDITRRMLEPYQPHLDRCLRKTLDIRILGGMLDLKCFGMSSGTGQHMLSRQSACARLDAKAGLLRPEKKLFEMLVQDGGV